MKNRIATSPILFLTTCPPSPYPSTPEELEPDSQQNESSNKMRPSPPKKVTLTARQLELQRLRAEAIKAFPGYALSEFFYKRRTAAIEKYIQQGMDLFDSQQNEISNQARQLELQRLKAEVIKDFPGYALGEFFYKRRTAAIEQHIKEEINRLDL